MDEMISYIFSTLHDSAMQAKRTNRFIKDQNDTNNLIFGLVIGLAVCSYINCKKLKNVEIQLNKLTKELRNQKGE